MSKQSTNEQLRDIIAKLGGVAKGTTTSELLDEVENLVTTGGSVTPAQLEQAVEDYMTGNRGELDSSDFDDIFGD